MHDRPGRDRGLVAAVCALRRPRLGFQRPAAFAAAHRTDEPLGPALFREVRRTGGFVRKLALEFEQGSGKRAHDRAPGPAYVHSMLHAIPSDLSPYDAVPKSRG